LWTIHGGRFLKITTVHPDRGRDGAPQARPYRIHRIGPRAARSEAERRERHGIAGETFPPPGFVSNNQMGRPGRPRLPWPLPERRSKDDPPHASAAQVARRLLVWIYALAYYGLHRLRHRFHGHVTDAERGILLRETLERMGGTFVKLGQQLSTRLDLLPFATCNELSKMLDAMPPFPTEQAIAAIERGTGKPLEETFSAFDPKPLGSASVACVYHAVLLSGEEVAVKVRRPGVGALFAADLAVLDLFCSVAEALTLIRPGFTRAVRSEVRTMLIEELEFFDEARYQELFRRQARRDRQHVTAPRVFHQHCGKDVIVSEFVKGVWLQDLVTAVDKHDEEALRYAASLGIDPEVVARRLLHTLYWANFENLFYHADPHPANVVVQPNNELVFLDFGACGPTLHRNRRNYVELFARQGKRDVQGMVQVFTNIISPLPPLDEHRLHRDGEALTARWQYGFESKHPEWWERSSAGMWIGMLELTRKYNIPVTIDTVRLVRSSLLYDTIAARLCDTIDMQREFTRYRRAARRRTLRRRRLRPSRAARPGELAAEIDRLGESLNRHLYNVERFAARPAVSFAPSSEKRWFAVSDALRLGAAVLVTTVAATTLTAGGPREISGLGESLDLALSSPWYWSVLSLLALRTYRTVRLRLGEPAARASR
jgi:ubiquinone biosynthesis protein